MVIELLPSVISILLPSINVAATGVAPVLPIITCPSVIPAIAGTPAELVTNEAPLTEANPATVLVAELYKTAPLAIVAGYFAVFQAGIVLEPETNDFPAVAVVAEIAAFVAVL
jgi:hypothetical protein